MLENRITNYIFSEFPSNSTAAPIQCECVNTKYAVVSGTVRIHHFHWTQFNLPFDWKWRIQKTWLYFTSISAMKRRRKIRNSHFRKEDKKNVFRVNLSVVHRQKMETEKGNCLPIVVFSHLLPVVLQQHVSRICSHVGISPSMSILCTLCTLTEIPFPVANFSSAEIYSVCSRHIGFGTHILYSHSMREHTCELCLFYAKIIIFSFI